VTDAPRPFVAEARLELAAGVDPAAVGAAVTTELCGHWEHEGACRWPHNNEIGPDDGAFRFRTLFVAEAGDEPEVRARIESALRGGEAWTVLEVGGRAVAAHETALAERLARG
jgi:hypothetical protein